MRFLLLTLFFTAVTINSFSQTKNFIAQPYIKTTATVDSLVVPDRIYLTILIDEKKTRGRTSIEELENKMNVKLKELGIDTDKQLSLADLGSNFKRYFIRKTDIQKNKLYQLLIYDAQTAWKAIVGLESIGISNVNLKKIEYSKIEELKIYLKQKSVLKAKKQAEAMLQPLDQKLGKVLYISDTKANISKRQTEYRYSRLKEEHKPIDIEFEKIRVESTVNVNFAIE